MEQNGGVFEKWAANSRGLGDKFLGIPFPAWSDSIKALEVGMDRQRNVPLFDQ